MAETSGAKPAKQVMDVSQPGKTAPSQTSRAVIINHKPILNDPMVKGAETDQPTDQPETPSAPAAAKLSTKIKIQPLASSPKPKVEPEIEPEAKPEPETVAEPVETAVPEPVAVDQPAPVSQPGVPDKPKDPAATTQAEDAQEAEHETHVQKLIDSKQFFLPIDTIENRRSKQFVALGVLISLLLAVAWADIALDAGMISASNIPHTHFFSSSATK
jgi:hypothetical protein